MPRRESEPLRYLFDDPDIHARNPQELDHRESDGTGANHDRSVARLGPRASGGVNADAERLDQRDLSRWQLRDFVELLRREHDQITHPAVDVDPDDTHSRAAVRTAAEAGGTLATGDVRIDGATIARGKPVDAVAGFHHFDAQFVAQDARIAEEGLRPFEGMQVRAADADGQDAHQHFVCSWRARPS